MRRKRVVLDYVVKSEERGWGGRGRGWDGGLGLERCDAAVGGGVWMFCLVVVGTSKDYDRRLRIFSTACPGSRYSGAVG